MIENSHELEASYLSLRPEFDIIFHILNTFYTVCNFINILSLSLKSSHIETRYILYGVEYMVSVYSLIGILCQKKLSKHCCFSNWGAVICKWNGIASAIFFISSIALAS